MSRVLWQKLLMPDLSAPPATLRDEPYKDEVTNTRAYEKPSAEIAIPDPKAFRSMSRASIFLAHIVQDAKDALAPYQAKTPFSVGVYCAVENGPIDGPSTAKILAQPDPENFAEHYRKFRNPKMYLKQLPNLAPAQTGIFMDLSDPLNVYTHSLAGAWHALDQAEWDLESGVVDAALVCTAHAFDDFLVVKRARRVDPRCLTEGAAALLLVKDGGRTDWTSRVELDPRHLFGISDPLINLLRRS